MKKVITYGTFDMLHFGHIRLLERAKALGDYLIVGVTSDDYDKTRGKINNQQSFMERAMAVKATGLVDEVIAEEYEGQKIDDIINFGVDIFAIGSDWEGYFDYLSNYCNVIYLPRTEGISSSQLRTEGRKCRIGIVGDNEERVLLKYINEFDCVNGAEISCICSSDVEIRESFKEILFVNSFDEVLNNSDAVYILSHPSMHYEQILKAINRNKHVLVEMPVTLSKKECNELFFLAKKNNVILMPAMKTAYCTAYWRLLLLAKGGKLGKIVSVDATCTSLRNVDSDKGEQYKVWNSICAWGPTAMLPVFHILGTEFEQMSISSLFLDKETNFDLFTKIDFKYKNAVASIKVGRGVKSEGELIISGTKGYIYVPAPWWKTDYFELRFENPEDNRRYYYQLDGEGIRYEIVAFLKAINTGKVDVHINEMVSETISQVMEEYFADNVTEII